MPMVTPYDAPQRRKRTFRERATTGLSVVALLVAVVAAIDTCHAVVYVLVATGLNSVAIFVRSLDPRQPWWPPRAFWAERKAQREHTSQYR